MTAAPTGERAVRLAILDDHPILLTALSEWIHSSDSGIEVAATAGSWPDLLAHPAFPTDVVLLDIDLGDDLDLVMKIRTLAAAGAATIIISTHSQPETIRRAMAAGCHGYLVKSEPTEVIIEAIRAAAAGTTFLTPETRSTLAPRDVGALTDQERRVVRLFVEGMSLKQVAQALHITPDTAKSYLRNARVKYREVGASVGTKIALRRQALRDGIIDSRPEA